MPILSQKNNPPSCNLNTSIIDSQGTWWIAKVKPRQEKVFAYDLLERGIEYYLPLYTKVTIRSDGKNRKTSLVLFPSYVPFVSDNPYPLLGLNRIATILPVQAQMRFKKQLNQVYVANESDLIINSVSTINYHGGEFVKVISGPLKGFVGKTVRTQGSKMLILEVDGIGSACITINSFEVELTKAESFSTVCLK